MKTLTIKNARNNFAEMIELVAGGGNSFIITKFGKPKAKIIPFQEKTQKSSNITNLFGIWKDRTDMVDSSEWETNARASWGKRNG